MHQYDHSRGDCGAAADVADAFAGFRFDADVGDVDIQVLCDRFSHRVDVRRHLGAFGKDDGIEVADFHARVMNAANRFGQKVNAVAAAIGRVVVGEQTPDVFGRDRSQQRVGDRVQQHIGVAVPDRVDLRRHVDAANPKRTAVAQPVRVVTESDTKWEGFRFQGSGFG